VRLIRVRLVLVNLNPINDTYIHIEPVHKSPHTARKTPKLSMMSIRGNTTVVRSLKTNPAIPADGSSKPGPGSSSKPESKLRSVSSNNRTCKSAKTQLGKPDGPTRAGSSTSRRVLTSSKTNHSIKHTFSRAASAPEGLLKTKNLFSRATSAPYCAHDDEELFALETLETLRIVVSNGAGPSSCKITRSVAPHSVLTNNNQWRAENAFVDKENGKKARQLNRHRSWPTSNAAAADNVVIRQDLIDRSSARKTIATRINSSESRGTRQMVAFCEAERLKARSLSAQTHLVTQMICPAQAPRSTLLLVIFQTLLLVLYMLFAILWTFFAFF